MVRSWVWAVVLIVAGALLGVVIRGCFGEHDTPEGHRADTALAEAPHWEDTVTAQNATIARLTDSIARVDRARQRWEDSATTLVKASDKSQTVIDSTVARGVPAGVEPAVFWRNAFEAQRRVAGGLRMQTIPALLATIAADSQVIRLRDIRADSLERQRDEARRRVAGVTVSYTHLTLPTNSEV